MNNDVQEMALYRQIKKPGDYIGTVNELSRYGTIKGVISPVTDNFTANAYGERISGMINVTVISGTPGDVRDILQLKTGKCYKIISVSRYSSHDIFTAERDEKAEVQLCR